MEPQRLVKVSKYLSRHLRHDPGRLGLVLEAGGWVEVSTLLSACHERGMSINRAELDEVVARSDKQRFSFDETGTRIRANQGHTVDIDLGLTPVEPPEVLYHGTNGRAWDSIRTEGLRRMSRHHVHLSPDVDTARRVGARRGKPVLLRVDAAGLAAAGAVFFCSDNGV